MWISQARRTTAGLLLATLLPGMVAVENVFGADRETTRATLEGTSAVDRIKMPVDLASDEIDAYLAGVTDAQARALLKQQLDSASMLTAAAPAPPRIYTRMIMHLRDVGFRLSVEARALLRSLDEVEREIRIMVRNLTDDKGWPEVLDASGVLLLLAAAGFLLLIPVRRMLRDLRNRLLLGAGRPLSQRLVRQLGDIAVGLLLVFMFALATLALSFLAFERFHPLRIFVASYLIAIAAVWGIDVVLRGLLPGRGEHGSHELAPAVALKTRRYLLAHFTIVVFGLASSALMEILGASSELDRVFRIVIFTLACLVLLAGILDLRRVLRDWLRTPQGGESLSGDYARIWHWTTLLGVVVCYFVWLLNTILNHLDEAAYAYLGLLLVLLLPLFVYQASRVGAKVAAQPAGEADDKAKQTSFAGLVRLLLALLYTALLVVFLADALGAGIFSWLGSDSGRMLLRSLFNSFLAIAVGVLSWEVFRTFVERHMPEPKQDLEALMEGDGGGGEGATRSATLLPLLRNFVLVMIIAVVVIIVLSSLGVNTAPLLAGAGVVGIAIGFGAQKLVQDVVSGIFFLIDDAFRVGEYIEAGEMVGTVESISARSVRLRHHLGPVQTIPFGEIKAVKNHSRDFVIMKLKFRVPFDTDIEQVRKVIKKVGREMLRDEELGADFLAPVKSQGVLNVEDDALLMRMKFTAKPGKQWVIRREAYRRVKEALEAEGIRFANKQVTVHIPEDRPLSDKQRTEIAGSAAGIADEPGAQEGA